jgi:autotransporter translocation and assembly factor TamB
MDALGVRPPDPRHPRRCLGRAADGWGKREIASLASGALSGEGKSAQIAGIEGFLPFDVRVDRVPLGDPHDHWLEVDGARFHLLPSALLPLRVEIADRC